MFKVIQQLKMDPDERIDFGKYSGRTMKELVEKYPSYCRWLFDNIRGGSDFHFVRDLHEYYNSVIKEKPKIGSSVKGEITLGIKNIIFRSKAEAAWARFITSLGWEWEYEPDLGLMGYIPDFLLYFKKEKIILEVKGGQFKLEELKSHADKIKASGWKGSFLIVGSWITGDEFHEDNMYLGIFYKLKPTGIWESINVMLIQHFIETWKHFSFGQTKGGYFCPYCGGEIFNMKDVGMIHDFREKFMSKLVEYSSGIRPDPEDIFINKLIHSGGVYQRPKKKTFGNRPIIGPKGIIFRTSGEAKWAEFMTSVGWEWEYGKSVDLKRYTPTFLLKFGERIFAVEVKDGATEKDLAEISENIYRNGWWGSLIVVGTKFIPHEDGYYIGLIFHGAARELIECPCYDPYDSDNGAIPSLDQEGKSIVNEVINYDYLRLIYCHGHVGLNEVEGSWRCIRCGIHDGTKFDDFSQNEKILNLWAQIQNKYQYYRKDEELPIWVTSPIPEFRIGTKPKAVRENRFYREEYVAESESETESEYDRNFN